MDAIRMLEREHQEAKDAMEAISELPASAAAKKKKAFLKLKAALQAHDQVEETIFYPSVMSHPAAANFGAQDKAAHEVVEEALAKLAELSTAEESWATAFSHMQAALLRHVKDEEENLFPKIRELLSPGELQALGKRMKEGKQQLAQAA